MFGAVSPLPHINISQQFLPILIENVGWDVWLKIANKDKKKSFPVDNLFDPDILFRVGVVKQNKDVKY